MSPTDAWQILGLDPTADRQRVRDAFVRAIRESHPDLIDLRESRRDPARVIEAYRVLCDNLERLSAEVPVADATPPVVPTNDTRPPGEGIAVATAADALLVMAPPAEAFQIVCEALNEIGDVTYVDRLSRLAQSIVTFVDGPVCYLHISILEGPEPSPSAVVLTIESLQRQPAPAIGGVTELVVAAIVDRYPVP